MIIIIIIVFVMSWLLGIWITAVNRSKYTVSILPPDKWYIQTTTSTPTYYHFDNRSHHHHHHHHHHDTHEYYQQHHHHHRNAHDINDSSSSSSTSNNDLSNSINRNSTSSSTIATLKGRRVGEGGNRVAMYRNHSTRSSKIIYRQNEEHHIYDNITNYDLNDAYLIKSLLRNKRIIFVGDSLSR